MLVKIAVGETPIVEVARVCGCAPCQIVAVNRVRSEIELKKLPEILVPVVTALLVTSCRGNF